MYVFHISLCRSLLLHVYSVHVTHIYRLIFNVHQFGLYCYHLSKFRLFLGKTNNKMIEFQLNKVLRFSSIFVISHASHTNLYLFDRNFLSRTNFIGYKGTYRNWYIFILLIRYVISYTDVHISHAGCCLLILILFCSKRLSNLIFLWRQWTRYI